MAPRLKEKYYKELAPKLKEELGIANVNDIPKLEKIVVNMGVGEAATDSKLRAGMPIGAKVTLRGDRMYEFFDRLIAAAIPRIRDFRGLPANSFDGHGNYSMGVTEQIIFPEIDYDKVDRTRGMDITFVTTAKTDEEGKALLTAFGFPFAA